MKSVDQLSKSEIDFGMELRGGVEGGWGLFLSMTGRAACTHSSGIVALFSKIQSNENKEVKQTSKSKTKTTNKTKPKKIKLGKRIITEGGKKKNKTKTAED